MGGTVWEDALQRHMTAAYNTQDAQAAYGEIGSLLKELGDPYTKVIPPQEYDEFRISSDGEVKVRQGQGGGEGDKSCVAA